MRPSPQSLSSVAGAKRLQHLAAAFTAFRRANGPRRRIPLGLRTQVAIALEAGVSASAIQKACGLSWSQTRRWRLEAQTSGAVMAAPQVLSVVDHGSALASSSPGDGIELRIGAWQIKLSRVAD
jgi:hypothetical protein